MGATWRWASRACLPVLIVVLAACSPSAAPSSAGGSAPAGGSADGSAPVASPDVSAPAAAGSYAEYATATCAALQSLWRAYGNPETSEMSAMYRAFDASVQAGDLAAAATGADGIVTELERGRASAAIASGWPPGMPSAVQVDRLLRATEAMVRAKRDATPQGHRIATDRGQAAFEALGGIDAWYGMLTGIDAAMKAARQPWPPCTGVPIG